MQSSMHKIALVLLSYGCLVTVIYGIAALEYEVSVGLGWTLNGLVPALVGYGLWRKARQARQADLQKTILRLAKQHDNLLTAADVALETELDMGEAEQQLEVMRTNGLMRLKVADNGTWVYECSSLLTMEEKRRAESLY
ncbi:hypothetical protein [Paenibacillus sp. FSL K6-1230]|uniref:hypothetical protein n=1 Tax=Paenibacillus sp. FSL K6-1230 TaxID=2921603 RepID=UPI0030F7C00D